MEHDNRLDLFGQLPSLNLYTQLSLCYPVTDESLYPAITEKLAAGLAHLSDDIPWIAGQITNSSPEGPAHYRIVPFEAKPKLVVRDLRNTSSVATMATLQQRRFPCSLLHETNIASHTTFQQSIAGSGPEPSVVFAVQANLISGGIILTFVAHHQAMDLVAQGRIMHLLSRVCNGGSLASEDIATANLARYNILPLLPDSDSPNPDPEDHSTITTSLTSNSNATEAVPPSCVWSCFSFSKPSLTSLKALAMESRAPTASYISTDDALTALIWQSITRSRVPRLDGTTKTTMTRAVDMRRYFGISPDYPGMMQTLSFQNSTIQELATGEQMPLGLIASQLRLAVQPDSETSSGLVHETRALAATIARESGEKVSYTADINLSTDVMISSWANQHSYSLDFGLGLGLPEAVRRPSFTPVESLVYFIPKRLDGEIVVMLCLREEDMDGLREDANFKTFAEYIG